MSIDKRNSGAPNPESQFQRGWRRVRVAHRMVVFQLELFNLYRYRLARSNSKKAQGQFDVEVGFIRIGISPLTARPMVDKLSTKYDRENNESEIFFFRFLFFPGFLLKTKPVW